MDATPPVDDSNPVLSRLAKRMRAARQARGLSLSVVAQTVGCSQQYLSLVETAQRDPDFSLVAKLAVVLDLDILAVVYGQKVAGQVDQADQEGAKA